MASGQTPVDEQPTSQRLAQEGKRLATGVIRARETGLIVAILALCVLLAFLTPNFLTEGNIFVLSRQISLLAIVAVGMSFVILTGGIDLSVGSVTALVSVVVGYVTVSMGLPFIVGILAGAATGFVVGLTNGLLTVKTGVHSFVITLGMLGIARGIALGTTGGSTTSGFSSGFLVIGQGSLLGIPIPVIILIVLAVAAHIVLSRTTLGRHIYFVGSNEEAAKLSGIKVQRLKVLVFVVASTLAAISGVVLTSRLATALPSVGVGLELSAIGAVIIGGASLFGGVGTILGAVLGATLLGLVENGLVLLGVSTFWQQAVTGAIIILAVAFNTYSQRQ
ncbi:MAG: ABC transporter permease [Rubrobacteraceae bacterium]